MMNMLPLVSPCLMFPAGAPYSADFMYKLVCLQHIHVIGCH